MNYLFTTAYLPPIQYMARLYAAQHVFIEQHDHYIKQTYRNRTVIATENGPLSLTIPILRTGKEKRPMRDLKISDHDRWAQMHWRAIVSAYDNSPYFMYYEEYFKPLYEHPTTYLLDFNHQLLETVCSLLNIKTEITYTTEYINETHHNFIDCRELIHPKNKIINDKKFKPETYHQVFEQRFGFLPNLSILDLLFNMGPESRIILRNSILDIAETMV